MNNGPNFIRLLIFIGAPILAAFALIVMVRFGSADRTEAAMVITGMLLFLLGIVVLAFLIVLVFHLIRRRGRGNDLAARIMARADNGEEDR